MTRLGGRGTKYVVYDDWSIFLYEIFDNEHGFREIVKLARSIYKRVRIYINNCASYRLEVFTKHVPNAYIGLRFFVEYLVASIASSRPAPNNGSHVDGSNQVSETIQRYRNASE